MTTKVVTVPENTSFKEIVRTLTDHGIGAAPVVDAEDRLIGVVSKTDLLRKQAGKALRGGGPGIFRRRRLRKAGVKASGDVAREVMSAPPVTVESAATVPEAARALAAHAIDHLPVVDADGCLLGIVGRADLLRVFLEPDERIREEVIAEVVTRALAEDPAVVAVEVRDGVVTLRGQVELRSLVPIAVNLTRDLDGVVDVIDRLSYRFDDSGPMPYPRA